MGLDWWAVGTWAMKQLAGIVFLGAVTGCAGHDGNDELHGEQAPVLVDYVPGVFAIHSPIGNCGAFAIGPRKAITAAHCLDEPGGVVFSDTATLTHVSMGEKLDRAVIQLDDTAADFGEWYTVRDPEPREQVWIPRPVNGGRFDATVKAVVLGLNNVIVGAIVTAEVKPGDSGSPAIGLDGAVIGLATNGAPDQQGYLTTASGL